MSDVRRRVEELTDDDLEFIGIQLNNHAIGIKDRMRQVRGANDRTGYGYTEQATRNHDEAMAIADRLQQLAAVLYDFPPPDLKR